MSRAVRIVAGIGSVETVGVGQQHQQVRLDQQRHLRRQGVVVTETELVGRGGVVLVDDRHYFPVEQTLESVAGV